MRREFTSARAGERSSPGASTVLTLPQACKRENGLLRLLTLKQSDRREKGPAMESYAVTAIAVGGPTLLLEYGGLRLLTDPAFDPPGEYPRDPHEPVYKRTGPAISPDQLGAVDVVLLSHDHHP